MKQAEYLRRIAARDVNFNLEYVAEADRLEDLEDKGQLRPSQVKRKLNSFEAKWYNENLIFSKDEEAELKAIIKETKLNFQKCNKFWGVILLDYLQNENPLNIDKWTDIINITRLSKEFTSTIWNGISKGERQNTTKKGINTRLKRLNDFYENKDAIAAEHGIKWENYKE